MITFAAGLVLREGSRSFAFERQLEGDKVQFKYFDNFEVRTFSLARLYADILAKKIIAVHQNGHPIQLPGQLNIGSENYSYPLTLCEEQEAVLENRLFAVKSALAQRIKPGSLEQCRQVLLKLSEKSPEKKWPTASTLRHWLKKYLGSGSNPYSLLDLRPLVLREKRLSVLSEQMMVAALSKYYLQPRGLSVVQTHKKLEKEVETRKRTEGEDIEVPSLRSLHRRVNEIPPYIRDYKRLGPDYARNRWRYSLAGDQSTHILERVEIDHTMLDLWVLDPHTGVPIGRPWITVILDRFSGYPLGIYISFYGPCVGSVVQAIKNSILPKHELLAAFPELQVPWLAMGVADMYVVDNGLEFHAIAFRRLAWELRADLLYNAVRQPWLKASIERAMMEVNRTLPRQGKVYESLKNCVPIDPKKTAAILFDDLCVGLLAWASDLYPRHIHYKNLVRPIDLWEEGLRSSPLPRLPLSFDQFEIISGISTTRTVNGDGVFFHYLRYNSVELQDYLRSDSRKIRTEVRFNPNDLGQIHVHLPRKNEWLSVPLQRPQQSYGAGLSLIQHEIIRDQAAKRLTRANAEIELEAARERLVDLWSNAVHKGVKARRDSNLIRLQGLSSSVIFDGNSQAPVQPAPLPEKSDLTVNVLRDVVPFKSFSLLEEEL
jgi:putative transposase